MDRCLRFVCLLVIAMPWCARGQQYRLDLYQQANGLSNPAVQDIAFDKSGFLWIATQNGLFRFLGSNFERYGSDQGIDERNVYQVYVDPQGRVWAGTYEPSWYDIREPSGIHNDLYVAKLLPACVPR